MGKFTEIKKSKIVKVNERIITLTFRLNFFPIKRFNKERTIPKIYKLLKLKFVKTIPCSVTKIFQIEISKNKNKDEIKQ